MVVFTWIVRSILEPLFWNLLQWVWSLDSAMNADAGALPIQFYSYSSTGLLLWLFEKLPHSLLLAIFACGCCTILGFILVFCCISTTLAWKIVRLLFSFVIVRLIKAVFWFWLIIAHFGLRMVYKCTRASIRTVNRAHRAIRDRHSVNSVDAIAQQFINDRQIADRPSETVTQAIDAAAFRPRRRRVRSARSPRRSSRASE